MAFFRNSFITIHPLFWVVALFIGWISTNTLSGTILWVGVIFISVLIHEFGHAFFAKLFHQHPKIALVAMGGVTSYEGKNLNFKKQFLITLAGPLFGFLLFLLSDVIVRYALIPSAPILSFFQILRVANFFWTVINLFPIQPLDGGQLLRITLEGFFGIKGVKISLFVGIIFALLVSIAFFILQNFLVGALFFLFAFQSFDSYRKSKYLSSSDRQRENSILFQQAERAMEVGQKERAFALFEKVRETTKEGILFAGATYYLALLLTEKGEAKKAYEILLEVKDHLPEEAIPLLHELAYLEKNYPLVAELSSTCYQMQQKEDIALKNAIAFGFLNQTKPAGGWLKTALDSGSFEKAKLLQHEAFEKIRDNKEFLSFLEGK